MYREARRTKLCVARALYHVALNVLITLCNQTYLLFSWQPFIFTIRNCDNTNSGRRRVIDGNGVLILTTVMVTAVVVVTVVGLGMMVLRGNLLQKYTHYTH